MPLRSLGVRADLAGGMESAVHLSISPLLLTTFLGLPALWTTRRREIQCRARFDFHVPELFAQLTEYDKVYTNSPFIPNFFFNPVRRECHASRCNDVR